MVTQLYAKELVGFEKVKVAFEPGLVVLSGPSGAGKSVLLSALLALFGFDTPSHAALAEAVVRKPDGLEADAFDLEEEEIVIRQIKKEKLRYFIDEQHISKKRLKALFAPYVKYLSARDQSGLESDVLLRMVDAVASQDKAFVKLKKEFTKRYRTYMEKKRTYDALLQAEQSAAERREFLRFEIEKIDAIAPKIGEEEELLEIKKRLSRLDKLKEASRQVEAIFAYESAVERFYALSEGDASLFDEAMNRLRADVEASNTLAEELEEIDVESVLDRLGQLNGLIKRFGTIEAALAYRDQKAEELARMEHMEADKSHLERFLEAESVELAVLGKRLSAMRQEAAREMEASLARYLEALKLAAVRFVFEPQAMQETGTDKLNLTMDGSRVETLSGGEFNRVRLALMAVSAQGEGDNGVIVLDEIDANVSGDESIAIADLVARLARHYQIFAISHQPHLAAKATQHLLIRKEEGKSSVKILNETERIAEIARIIGGENPGEEAVEFAKTLRATEARYG